MVKLTRIYTRGGDTGETGIVGGARLPKNAARIEAIGAVDEANAAVGLARLDGDGASDAILAAIQNDLFDLGADLATPGEDFTTGDQALRITDRQVGRLEGEIDGINEKLAPLASFVLPGGTRGAAALHFARTIVRRAERRIVALAAIEAVNPAAVRYVNRLSDLLFVLARRANDGGDDDVLWVPGAGRDG